MVHDEHARSGVDERVERLEHPRHVLAVQARARLVEHVQHALLRPAQRAGELHPLRLAAGERRQRLTHRQVPEPEPLQRPERLGDRPIVAERGQRLVDGHPQQLGDRVPLQPDLEHLGLEAAAAAARAGERHVGEELHLHRLAAFAGAGLAAATLDVEREVGRAEPAEHRVRLRGEALPEALPGRVYVAALPREVRPSGAWSTRTTRVSGQIRGRRTGPRPGPRRRSVRAPGPGCGARPPRPGCSFPSRSARTPRRARRAGGEGRRRRGCWPMAPRTWSHAAGIRRFRACVARAGQHAPGGEVGPARQLGGGAVEAEAAALGTGTRVRARARGRWRGRAPGRARAP